MDVDAIGCDEQIWTKAGLLSTTETLRFYFDSNLTTCNIGLTQDHTGTSSGPEASAEMGFVGPKQGTSMNSSGSRRHPKQSTFIDVRTRKRSSMHFSGVAF